MDKFSYVKTLKESFRLTFKNFFVFLPLAITFLLSFALIPYSRKFADPASIISSNTLILIPFIVIFSLVFYLIIYSWLFTLIRTVINKKKSNFSEILKLAWKLFKVGLILFGLSIIVSIVFVTFSLLIAALAIFIPILGFILAALLGLAFFILLIIISFALFYLAPILIMEDLGALESLKLNYLFFMKHKKNAIKMGLLTILVLIVAYIPLLIIQFSTIIASFKGQIVQLTTMSLIYNNLLSIPILIAYVVITMFYTISYMKIKRKK